MALNRTLHLGTSWGGGGAVTLDPANKSSVVTLSNGNLTAFSSDSTGGAVRSTTSHTTGKYSFKVTADSLGTDFGITVGLCQSGASMADGPFSTLGAGFVLRSATNVYITGSNTTNLGHQILRTGETGEFFIDLDNKKMWVRGDASFMPDWNNSGTDNPSTNTGGIDISSIVSGAMFIAVYVALSDQATFNFLSTPVSGSISW